jgi:hypothetical protein
MPLIPTQLIPMRVPPSAFKAEKSFATSERRPLSEGVVPLWRKGFRDGGRDGKIFGRIERERKGKKRERKRKKGRKWRIMG